MKIEFNPDGSIKLPNNLVKKKEDDEQLFLEKPCIRIIRDQISNITPLSCELKIQASNPLQNPEKNLFLIINFLLILLLERNSELKRIRLVGYNINYKIPFHLFQS